MTWGDEAHYRPFLRNYFLFRKITLLDNMTPRSRFLEIKDRMLAGWDRITYPIMLPTPEFFAI